MMILALLVSIALSAQEREESTQALEERMLQLINAERQARRIPPLTHSPRLAEVAREYSRKMAAAGKIHHDLDVPVQERVLKVLPGTCQFAENVSKHTSVDYSIADLMMSPGHRANLLSSQLTEIGIGIVRGDGGFLYITQEFARPCDPQRERRP